MEVQPLASDDFAEEYRSSLHNAIIEGLKDQLAYPGSEAEMIDEAACESVRDNVELVVTGNDNGAWNLYTRDTVKDMAGIIFSSDWMDFVQEYGYELPTLMTDPARLEVLYRIWLFGEEWGTAVYDFVAEYGTAKAGE